MGVVATMLKKWQFLLQYSFLKLYPVQITEDYPYQSNKGSMYQNVLN